METATPVTVGSPRTQRLTNKSWKVRVEAYSELLDGVKSQKLELGSVAKYIVPMIQDSNPQAREQALEILDLFLKARANGKSTPAVDVAEVTSALLELKDKKRAQSAIALCCRAWSCDAVCEALLSQAEHRAKQRSVPALETLRVLASSFSSRLIPSLLRTASAAAQTSDPAVRRAALEVLAALHPAMGDALLEQCGPLLRPPILASLRELLAKSVASAAPNVAVTSASVVASPPKETKENSRPVSAAPTPVRVARPPSQLPAPTVVVQQQQQQQQHQQHHFVVETEEKPIVAPSKTTKTEIPSKSVLPGAGSSMMEEWTVMHGWVMGHLQSLEQERRRNESLTARCAELETENAELLELAKELETAAVAETRSGVEAIQSMSMEELTEAEKRHQEAMTAIVQRKKTLIEEMAKRNECVACGKQRARTTIFFPCKHVVCTDCGTVVKVCPDCKGAIQQRYELPSHV